MSSEVVAFPCLIKDADFDKNTITLVMQTSDYKVSAGKHWLCTSPPQRQPLTDERLELVGHADLAINNIYIFNGYGEEVPEGRTPIYAGYKAAHGIKGKA